MKQTSQKTKQPKISKQQLTILFYLYTYRFLNTHHMQLLLHHKSHTRIHAWLKELLSGGYIYCFEKKNTFSGNHQPNVYCLDTKARSVLQDNSECDPYCLEKIYREKTMSERFRNHCLYLAGVAIQLQDDKTIDYFTKRELINYDYFLKPLPDAYIEVKKQKRKSKRYFLDLIDDKTPRFALRARVKQYLRYSEEDAWEKNAKVSFPTILMISPDNILKGYLERFITRTLEEECIDNLHFVIKEKSEANGLYL
jgi:hypothetical protein